MDHEISAMWVFYWGFPLLARVRDQITPSSTLLSLQGGLNIDALDERIRLLQDKLKDRPASKKKEVLNTEFQGFLQGLPSPTTACLCAPIDILRFLAFKDQSQAGKTRVHDTNSENLGKKGVHGCGCPRRLSANYVRNLIGSRKTILLMTGRGDSWDGHNEIGNPAYSQEVADYYLAVKEEQAEAHVTIKQATPLLPEKLVRMCAFLTRESQQKLVLLRDKAMFAAQFFAGERGGDLGKLLIQEVYKMDGDKGLVLGRLLARKGLKKSLS